MMAVIKCVSNRTPHAKILIMDKSGNVLVLSCDDPQMKRKMKEHDICDVASYKLFPSKA